MRFDVDCKSTLYDDSSSSYTISFFHAKICDYILNSSTVS